MAEDSDLERTEEATSRRLEQAREEGQVPHSRELSSFLVLIVSAALIWGLGGWMMGRVKQMAHTGFTFSGEDLRSPSILSVRLVSSSVDALIALSPMLLASLVAVLITPFLLNSWVFSSKALLPNFARLNPIQGLGRVFSVNGLVELVKALLKAALIGGVASWLLLNKLNELVGLLAEPLDAGLGHAGRLVAYSFLVIVAAMVLIVAVDVPFQLWSYYNKLKMTKEEVKQEGKEMEGNPQVKGRIRSLQRDAARRRMMSSVPTADVIVTNPTHFSVALSYTSGMSAPKVVAKGRGEVALKIREVAGKNGVPLLEAPPLARALYRWADIDQEIPSRLYSAVAEVLAYVYQLNRFRETGGQYPVPPRNVQVPAELDPGVVNG
jgi:flagellar biosynthesis protein FlhB